jgi:hypothetical protein
MFDLQNTGPVPEDLGTRRVFEKVQVPLGRLIDALGASGQPLTGRRFVDCVVHGPCVVIPGEHTRLENCNLGEASGDVRNLFLRAAGPMIVGGIPLNDCVFEGCIFIGVGFAGDDAFVDAFVAKLIPRKA